MVILYYIITFFGVIFVSLCFSFQQFEKLFVCLCGVFLFGFNWIKFNHSNLPTLLLMAQQTVDVLLCEYTIDVKSNRSFIEFALRAHPRLIFFLKVTIRKCELIKIMFSVCVCVCAYELENKKKKAMCEFFFGFSVNLEYYFIIFFHCCFFLSCLAFFIFFAFFFCSFISEIIFPIILDVNR